MMLSKLSACLTAEKKTDKAPARQVLGEGTSNVGGLAQSLGEPLFNTVQKCILATDRKLRSFHLQTHCVDNF